MIFLEMDAIIKRSEDVEENKSRRLICNYRKK